MQLPNKQTNKQKQKQKRTNNTRHEQIITPGTGYTFPYLKVRDGQVCYYQNILVFKTPKLL